MIPFPTQGLVNQLLQLACLITSSYDLPVHYVGSATHNYQARFRANALNPSDIAKIHFHDIPTPEFDSPPPDFNATSKFPSHHVPLWEASLLWREPIASFLPFTLYCYVCLFSEIPIQLGEELLKKLPSLEGTIPDVIRDCLFSQHPYMDIGSGTIHNTSKVIEGTFLDLLAQVKSKQHWAIGPFLPTKLDHVSNRNSICLEWLN
ncbi:zeatin O-glucosyltransferase-like [Capsicum annuum]|uniref:zeatin O-glucosyltransferase-like n=1 Tax=Capsicum annuum TaxID=4072 RepID=UPI001FB0B5CC|nr:zeatin O-glucosyltransferase-like [Capsicum annuum]